jgi:shikimate kinase
MTDWNIVLVGFMGAGKSAAGRRVAERLGYRYVDMDAAIEERTGLTIPQLFEREGEPRFRERERDLVGELAGRSRLVVSTGGGVVLNPLNIAAFERQGVVICLTADLDTILARIGSETHRPLLAGGDRREKARALLEKRKPFYDAIRHQIDTSNLTPDEVADRILELYRAAAG